MKKSSTVFLSLMFSVLSTNYAFSSDLAAMCSQDNTDISNIQILMEAGNLSEEVARKVLAAYKEKQESSYLYVGDSWSNVICDHMYLDGATVDVKVKEINGGYDVYMDGKLTNSCNDLEFDNRDRQRKQYGFYDEKLLEDLEDKEVGRLVTHHKLGTCSHSWGPRYGLTGASADKKSKLYKTFALEAEKQNVDIENNPSLEELGSVYRQLFKDGVCGTEKTFKGSAEERRKGAIRALAKANVGLKRLSRELSLTQLKNAGFSAKAMYEELGLGIEKLVTHGYSSADIILSGIDLDIVRDHFSAKDLRSDGVNLYYVREAGYSAKEVKEAGYSFSEIRDRYSDSEVKEIYSATDFRANGVNLYYVKEHGYTIQEAKAAGYSFSDIRSRYSDRDVKKVYTASDFKKDGVNLYYVKQYGYTIQEAKDAGYSFSDIRDRYSDRDVKSIYSASDFRKDGVNLYYVKQYGYTAIEAKEAGYSYSDIADRYSSRDVRKALSAKELRHAGVSLYNIKRMGYSEKNAEEAGFLKSEIERYY